MGKMTKVEREKISDRIRRIEEAFSVLHGERKMLKKLKECLKTSLYASHMNDIGNRMQQLRTEIEQIKKELKV